MPFVINVTKFGYSVNQINKLILFRTFVVQKFNTSHHEK